MSTIYVSPNKKKLVIMKKIRMLKALELATLFKQHHRCLSPNQALEMDWAKPCRFTKDSI